MVGRLLNFINYMLMIRYILSLKLNIVLRRGIFGLKKHNIIENRREKIRSILKRTRTCTLRTPLQALSGILFGKI